MASPSGGGSPATNPQPVGAAAAEASGDTGTGAGGFNPAVPPVGAASRLVWVDMEMSGLEVEHCHILEIACVVTDSDLRVLGELPGESIVIHQPQEVLDAMDQWNTDHHRASGLTRAVQRSEVSLQEAEARVLALVGLHCPCRAGLLAGNSVHADRVFLVKYMPRLVEYINVDDMIDVSTVKEACRRWAPEAFSQAPNKQKSHRALDDIRESIQELAYYRDPVFRRSKDPTDPSVLVLNR